MTIRVEIRHEVDVDVARARARALALREGLGEAGAAALATAVSEVARNIVVHAGEGEVLLSVLEERGRRGVQAVARDDARGIPDVDAAMADGYSTGTGLGLGLSSARRLVDAFTIVSRVGEGTTVTLTKFARPR